MRFVAYVWIIIGAQSVFFVYTNDECRAQFHMQAQPRGRWYHGLCECANVCCTRLWCMALCSPCCFPSLITHIQYKLQYPVRNRKWWFALSVAWALCHVWLVALYFAGVFWAVFPICAFGFLPVYFTCIVRRDTRMTRRPPIEARGCCCECCEDLCCAAMCTCCVQIQIAKEVGVGNNVSLAPNFVNDMRGDAAPEVFSLVCSPLYTL